MKRVRATVVVTVAAMVSALLAAGGPSIAGAPSSSAALHGSAIDVEFVHQTAPLKQIGR